MALPKCLDEIESFAYDPDYGEKPHLTLVGKKGKRKVVVEIYFEPFDDDEKRVFVGLGIGPLRGTQS